MEFTLLTAVLVLEGIYEKGEEGQLLTLRGGLARPFRVSELVALITGKEGPGLCGQHAIRGLPDGAGGRTGIRQFTGYASLFRIFVCHCL